MKPILALGLSGLLAGSLLAADSAGELKLEQARTALRGEPKDPAQAKALLLDIVDKDKDTLGSRSLCYVYVYMGYIEDRAGNRSAAIPWYKKALELKETDRVRECAESGLEKPLTWIRHLDEATTPPPGPTAVKISLASAPPVVVKTVPVAGATDVDPALTEIRVTYSKAMQNGSWSWSTWGEENYPETPGSAHYLSDGRTCVLPVKLKPDKFYAIWLNSDRFHNFKDADGRTAVPYLLTFSTGSAGSGSERHLRTLVEDFFAHNYRDITSRDTLEWGAPGKDEQGNLTIRYCYRARIWDKDTVTNNEVFTFDSQGKLVSVKKTYANSKARMMALVEKFFANNFRDITSRQTIEWGDVTKADNGNASIRYKYRAKIWDRDTVTNEQLFTFDPQDKFVSVDELTKRRSPSYRLPVRTYAVGRKVSDFPAGEDLSTPEAAYATIQRSYVAEGDAMWPRLSARELAQRMTLTASKPVTGERAERELNAEVVEVHLCGTSNATVLARRHRPGGDEIDIRHLQREDGRWLNLGNDGAGTLDQAREIFARRCDQRASADAPRHQNTSASVEAGPDYAIALKLFGDIEDLPHELDAAFASTNLPAAQTGVRRLANLLTNFNAVMRGTDCQFPAAIVDDLVEIRRALEAGDWTRARALAAPSDRYRAQFRRITSKMAEVALGQRLNDDQRLVRDWTDRQFRSFFDTRTFEGWSDQKRAELETQLIDTLKGPQTREYYQAINTLAAVRSTNALTALREIAFDREEKDCRDRWMAIRALGIIGDKSALPELIHLVYYSNQNTHWWAQISLVRLTGQNFGSDWKAWGDWWNRQGGRPPFNPEIIRWWSGQPEPDKLAESLAEADRKFLAGIRSQ